MENKDEIKKRYREAFLEHGYSPSSVLWPKGRQEERFHALTKHIPSAKDEISILDFGCGLAHLKPYLDAHFGKVKYTGIDIVEEFIEHNSKKYPGSSFFQPEEFFKKDLRYDYVVSSGAFNMLYDEDPEKHKRKVVDLFTELFQKTNSYLSIDFMTDLVDFKQAGAFHANPGEMISAFSSLSRRVILDHAYLPYEFCITIFKNSAIKRPDNIYEPGRS